ncbi:transposon Ty3-I Gag-Pol polyprotein [Trichonephila clavipes]|nr:transposon Ty3-I Gag-Pol polyprotein [Trichonephila clavipes]
MFTQSAKEHLNGSREYKWTETLPVVFGLRAAVKPDINASSTELVYGVSLRLPAEICTNTLPSVSLDYGFVQHLKNKMNNLKPLSTSTHGFSKNFVHSKLNDCTHVFLHVDKISPSMSEPDTGPHKVLSRNDKHITININGKKSCVSLDRVKPAFVLKDLHNTIPDPIISAESSHPHPLTTNIQTTKSGRRLLPQPPHSPDLEPTDYHLFHTLNFLRSKNFDDLDAVKTAIQDFLKFKSLEFYHHGIRLLPERWQEVMDNNGDYAQSKVMFILHLFAPLYG